MHKVIILRGVSGSGKSTKAHELFHSACVNGESCIICSADDYMINALGKYEFNPKKLQQCHTACQLVFVNALIDDVNLVILDNTNTQKWEYYYYLKKAVSMHYEVEEIIVGNSQDVELYAMRNTHNVPLESIKKQAQRFEM